jgi:hypothetical protein
MAKHTMSSPVFPVQVTVTYAGDTEVHGIYNAAQWEQFVAYEVSSFWHKPLRDQAKTAIHHVARAYKARHRHTTNISMNDGLGKLITWELQQLTN